MITETILLLIWIVFAYLMGRTTGKRWAEKFMWKANEIELILDDGSSVDKHSGQFKGHYVWRVPIHRRPAALVFRALQPGLLPFVDVSIPAYGPGGDWYRVPCFYERNISESVEDRYDIRISLHLPSSDFDKLTVSVTSCLLRGRYIQLSETSVAISSEGGVQIAETDKLVLEHQPISRYELNYNILMPSHRDYAETRSQLIA